MIPTIVRVGVIGHRSLAQPARIQDAVTEVYRRIDVKLRELSPLGGYRILVLSALAEGSDRLLARVAIAPDAPFAREGARLLAVFPFPTDEYRSDFETPESQAEFEQLANVAVTTCTILSPLGREQAYAESGRYIVDQCDILVAVWDGCQTNLIAGTAPMVGYARESGREMFIIDATSAQISEEPEKSGKSTYRQRIKETEYLNRINLPARLGANGSELLENQQSAGTTQGGCSLCGRYLKRTDFAANRFGLWSRLAADSLQWLSTIAVIVVAVQFILFPELHGLLWLEVTCMAGIVALAVLAARREWQRRWADCRYLAERLRAYSYHGRLSATALQRISQRRESRYLLPPRDWVNGLLAWIWDDLRLNASTESEVDIKSLKKDWLDSQTSFYATRSEQFHRRESRVVTISYCLFITTALAALLHLLVPDPRSTKLMTLIVIAFPAIGSALAGVRSHRELQRLMIRYRECAQHLSHLSRLLDRTDNPDEVLAIIIAADDVMHAEHADWHDTAESRDVSPK